MSLVETMKDILRRRENRKKVERIVEQYPEIVESVTFRGRYPDIYLIGEVHSEGTHRDFTCELLQTLKPGVLLAEAAPTWDLAEQPFSYAELFTLRGLDDLPERIAKYMNPDAVREYYQPLRLLTNGRTERVNHLRSQKCEELLVLDFTNVFGILQKPFYMLTEPETTLINLAYDKVMSEDLADLGTQLEAIAKTDEFGPNYVTIRDGIHYCRNPFSLRIGELIAALEVTGLQGTIATELVQRLNVYREADSIKVNRHCIN